MNPMTNIKNTQKISNREIELGTAGTKNSWHNRYKDSAWIFIGGLPYNLTEGDIICVFSQCGEIVNCNLVRDQKTGKSKGFMFLCFEDQRSTILAVDNFNGIKILNRSIRVDHVLDYKPPKDNDNDDEVTKHLRTTGCAPEIQSSDEKEEEDFLDFTVKSEKKTKKKKDKHKKHKKSRFASVDGAGRGTTTEAFSVKDVTVKTERFDAGYGDVDRSDSYRHSNGTERTSAIRSNRRDHSPRIPEQSSPRRSRTSPRQPSRSSRRRSPSPRQHSLSPRQRSPSPRRHSSPPPRRRSSPSPRRRNSPSPRRRGSPSPRRRGSPSPRRRGSPSPRRRDSVSPRRRGSVSPRRRSPPPRRRGSSPKRRGPAARRRSRSTSRERAYRRR